MPGHKCFRELVLTATFLIPTLTYAQDSDGNKAVVTQVDDVCLRLPTISNGTTSQLETDHYFNKSEADWTDKDLEQLSVDYHACYDKSLYDFGQKTLTPQEFDATVINIVESANNYRQAARVVQGEKAKFSSECQGVIDEIFHGGAAAPEFMVPFEKISQLHKDGHHDEACGIDKSFSTEFEKRRDLAMQCVNQAKLMSAKTFQPFWFSTMAGAADKIKSIVDADMSFYKCPR